MDCASGSHTRRRSVSPAGWRGGNGREFCDGARSPHRFLERWGKAIAIPAIGMQGRLLAKQRRGTGALILAVLLSFGLWAAIWGAVALLAGVDGELSAHG
jgi:hypothetical protein